MPTLIATDDPYSCPGRGVPLRLRMNNSAVGEPSEPRSTGGELFVGRCGSEMGLDLVNQEH